MELTKCLNCENKFEQPYGKREKRFCSDKCRVDFNQKRKAKTKTIPMEMWRSDIIKFVEAVDGQWNLMDGRKGNFVWAKDSTPVETKHTYLPAKEDIIVPKENGVVEVHKTEKHRLWKDGDPKEGSMAFFLKYDCYTYDELQNKQK